MGGNKKDSWSKSGIAGERQRVNEKTPAGERPKGQRPQSHGIRRGKPAKKALLTKKRRADPHQEEYGAAACPGPKVRAELGEDCQKGKKGKKKFKQ